jgi:replicative superfamily II helicase
LDKHFESASEAAVLSHDIQLDLLTRWLHAASRRMVSGSVWWVANKVNSRVTKFLSSVTKQNALFELLPPQRAALQEQGLLDQAAEAVVIELPTSGGKTLLAQFKMLQALNQFEADSGWVAYIAPTRALTAQITRRLRRDFSPLDIIVEQLTGAVEIDSIEETLLSGDTGQKTFDILVATPEKFQLVIRNKKVSRPLALVVMDEAHNIGDESRGLRIELLLATIKRECKSANFLLLMPYVENVSRITQWLSPDAGRTISIGTTAWKPNERIVGIYHAEKDDSVSAGWKLEFETLITSPETIHLRGVHPVGEIKPLDISYSRIKNSLSLQTGAMAKVLSERGTSIAVSNQIRTTWSMAREIIKSLPIISPVPDEIKLVQNFLANEISPKFELIEMLKYGVAVHHAGLSDEARALIEWLAEENKLKVLCATLTIAQGINFPVSSVFLSSRSFSSGTNHVEMKPRDFWNLAGRAGRLQHDSVGVIGLAAGEEPGKIRKFVSQATGELVSQLVKLLEEMEQTGKLHDLESVTNWEQWTDFRCYVAHLWNEKKNLDAVLSETEQLLRNTYGYGLLRSTPAGAEKADALLKATKYYVQKIAEHPENATIADATGFDPKGVGKALLGLNKLEKKLTIADWMPESLFKRKTGNHLSELFGIMLQLPQIKKQLDEIKGEGLTHKQIANMSIAWVSGESIQEIAKKYFKGEDTDRITDACKAIYRNLVNNGAWGIAALSKMPTSGINFDSLSEEETRSINLLPSMLYHGVSTEDAVLMRMNLLPRSIATKMGEKFREQTGDDVKYKSVARAREFLKSLKEKEWESVKPKRSYLSGIQYKKIWEILSGESR